MSKRIAVIGAGASGLCAIKSCVEEGLEPVCYERSNWIGGLWQFTQEVKDGQSCVMKTTVINTSKEIMSYSDYPISAESPVFMHNTKVVEYLKSYAKHFGMDKYINFNHEVLEVKPSDDFEKNGQWVIEVRDNDNGSTTTEVFDGVMVCSGHHADKRVPIFEGLDSFKGKVVHTHDYRDHVGYEDKKVLVVGIGNSGGDVAVELSRIAKQVYLSTRRGSWVINRIERNGYPVDLVLFRRVIEHVRKFFPSPMGNSFIEARINARFNHENYGLKPEHRFFSQHPMVNDELPNRIACGTIKIKPDVKKFGPAFVEFVDGSIEEDVDHVILATGFKFGFPFIKHPALEVKDNEVNLFKYVFPPDIKPGTLAVIGCVQPLGAIMPISEIQCRWAARVFSGRTSLPSAADMQMDVDQKRSDMRDRYVKSPRHTLQVDYVDIMDQIAEQFGCKPDIRRMFWEDPILAWNCYFGPFVPYQYRLVGPHKWDGARQTIMTVWDRTFAGTSRNANTEVKTSSMPKIIYVIGVIILFVFVQWFLGVVL